MKRAAAEILREYGPFPRAEKVHGLTFDRTNVWFASDNRLNALDPESGEIVRSIDVLANTVPSTHGTNPQMQPCRRWANSRNRRCVYGPALLPPNRRAPPLIYR